MAQVNEKLRRKMVAEAAYFRAEHRGFSDGDAVADWLAAEEEIEMRLGRHPIPIGGLEERLAATNDRLKAIRKKLAKMTGADRRAWEGDVDKLAKFRDRLRKRVREVREQSGSAAEKAKARAEKAWDEISGHLEHLTRRESGRS